MNPLTENHSKPAPQRPYRRRVRNIFIHKPMQREFTLVIVALLMVSSIAIGFVIHDTVREAAFGSGFRFGKINPYEVLSEVSYALILRVTCILFITLIVLGAFGIFFLHRIAGPVYRFRQILIRLNDSQDVPPPIKIREGDFFSEVVVELNRHLEKIQLEKNKDAEIKAKLDDILAHNPPPPLKKSLEELKDVVEKGRGREL